MATEKLYEISYDGTKAKIEEIEVLKEDITQGATVPSIEVKYPDGSKARCDRKMFAISKKGAVAEAINDIAGEVKVLEQEELKIKLDKEELRLKFICLKQLEKELTLPLGKMIKDAMPAALLEMLDGFIDEEPSDATVSTSVMDQLALQHFGELVYKLNEVTQMRLVGYVEYVCDHPAQEITFTEWLKKTNEENL